MTALPVPNQGTRLGRYELVRFLGEGGFAEVWLAALRGPAGFEKKVALKVLRRSRAKDVKHQTMLLDEALLVSKIEHPNVAGVHELAEENGLVFFVMEYVSGDSVDALMDGARELGEPIPLNVTARILVDACMGLHAAHELCVEGRPLGIVHRDVSPQNILLSEGGVAKVIDFGIAKARERIGKETTTGIAKGKLSYMAPEHARGEELDRRADVFAIAALAYEIFTGDTVVSGPNPVARMTALASGPITPDVAILPPPLAPILARALSFDRDARHASTDELRLEIEAALTQHGMALASHAAVAAFATRIHREAAAAREAAVAERGEDSQRPRSEVSRMLDARLREVTSSANIPMPPRPTATTGTGTTTGTAAIPVRSNRWMFALAGVVIVTLLGMTARTVLMHEAAAADAARTKESGPALAQPGAGATVGAAAIPAPEPVPARPATPEKDTTAPANVNPATVARSLPTGNARVVTPYSPQTPQPAPRTTVPVGTAQVTHALPTSKAQDDQIE
jgi:eukaryotic-like serine/threonine-protein kinase